MERGVRTLCAAVLAGGLAACALPRFEEQPWLEVRTDHFTILTHLSPDEARELATDIELFRAVVLRITGIGSVESRVPTLIYAFEDGYSGFAPPGSAGYFNSTLGGNYVALNASARGEDWEVRDILQHEYVHFLLRSAGSLRYPIWYNEGLAEFLSTVDIKDGQVRVGMMPRVRRLSFQYFGTPLSTRSLFEARSILTWNERNVAMVYAQGWLMTHFLHAGHLVGYENRNAALLRYLKLQNEGVAVPEACRIAFGTECDTLGQQAKRYLRRGRLPYATLPASDFDAGSPPTLRSLQPTEITFRLGELILSLLEDLPGFGGPVEDVAWPPLIFGPIRNRAQTLFTRTLLADPTHARAQMGLALINTQPGSTGELVSRALELGPNDAWIQYCAGRYRLEQAKPRAASNLSEAEHASLIEESRAHFFRAIELDGRYPPPLVGLGETYLVEGSDYASGIEALEVARSIVGRDSTVSILLAELYIATGRPDEARSLLEDVLYWSRSPRVLDRWFSSSRARELLERLDAEDTTESESESQRSRHDRDL